MTAVAPGSVSWSRDLVEPALRAAVDRLAPRLRLAASYHRGWWEADGTPRTGRSGKALRPALALLSAAAAGGPAEAAADKTSALLACSASIGARMLAAPAPLVDALHRFGRELGLAFQLVDDVLGIWGEPAVTGKPVLADVRAGRRSAPVVAALRSGTPAGDELAALLAGHRPGAGGRCARRRDRGRSPALDPAPTRRQSDVMTTARPTPLWRNRDFTLLWTSQVGSTIGTRVTAVAYPLLVLALTGSPTRAGVVAFAQTLPFLLLYLPAGAWVDRWELRRLMVGCELGRGVALGSIAVVAVLGGLDAVTVPQVAAVAFVEGCLFVLFDLAEGNALPRLVAAEQLPTAVAYNQGRIQAADLVGQPLGGVLFSIAPGLPFAVDAATYVLSGGAVATIRTRLHGDREPVGTRLREQIAEGLRFVRRDRYLRDTVALVGGINLAFNALTLVLIVRAGDLGATPTQIGLMFGLYGAGGILGALVAPRVHRAVPGRVLLVAIAWLWAGTAAAYVLAPSALWLGVVSAVGSFFGPIFNVVVMAAVYRIVPEGLLGRVRSTTKLVAWGTIPVAGLLGGVLAEHLGPVPALLCVAGLMLAMAVLTTLSPGLRLLATRPTLAPADH